MVRRLFFVVCALVAQLTALNAGGLPFVSIEPFPLMEQLPSGNVQRVFQDRQGFLWFGTPDGLCRFDGYDVRTFRSDMNHPFLLTSNDIQCMAEDDERCLWVGTKQGLNRMDMRNLRLTSFQDSLFKNDRINSLATDTRRNIWIGTNRGLYRYNLDEKELYRYGYDPNNPKTVSGTSVNSIYRDLAGNMWVMCWGSGLSLYDPKNDAFKRFPRLGTGNNPFRMYQDKQGRYWICTWGDGFYRFFPTAPSTAMYRPHVILNPTAKKPETTFFSMVQDDTYGYLWLMSLTGLYVVKPTDDGSLLPIDVSSYLKSSSRLYSEIVKDKDHNLWVGAFGEGALFINFEPPSVQNYSLDIVQQRMGFYPSVKALSEDEDGLVWIGMNRYGLCLYDRSSNVARMDGDIPGITSLKNIQTVNYIKALKQRNEHWITCNDHTVYRVRKQGRGVVLAGTVNLNANNGFYSMGDKVLFEDDKGNVWVGMSGGVIKVTPGNRVLPIAEIPFVTDITQDADGDIWVSSEQSGLCCLVQSGTSYKTIVFGKRTQGLNTNNVQSVAHLAKNNVWIGTKEGRVLVYDKTSRRFTDMSERCAMTGEGILNLLVDHHHHVWISTNKRVTRYDPATRSSTVYSVSDKLAVSSFVAGACSVNGAGEVLFGGNRGFCCFLPDKKKDRATVPPSRVVVTDVKIHNQSIFVPGHRSDFDIIDGSISLQRNDNNIEVEFSSLNYAFPNKIQYAYKLEGVDNNWNYTTSNRRFASYNNLGKGKYRLLLKATDQNGLWGKTITTFTIRIRPALYETWWAYLAYLIALGFILYGTYRFLNNRIRLKNELKYAKLEKEASEELTQTKLRYFTNISHELLTPLTVLSCLIDDLRLSSSKPFWQHEVMKINVDRLKRLLLQILDFRKIESGSLPLKVSESDLVTFVSHICRNTFEPLAREKHIQFSMIPEQASIVGWYDPEKMDTVLFNLLSNAFKYTPTNGNVRVDVAETGTQGHRKALVIVSDTGRGIAPEDLEHIFTRFYSNDPTNTVENHGIGLTLVKEMLELHHGSIRVESKPGEGSSFIVEIPLDKQDYTDAERVDTHPVQKSVGDLMADTTDWEAMEAGGNEAVEDLNLLIVEDNQELSHLMERILSRRYHTYVAANGKEALDLLGENSIDIVVSDIIMPEMNGLDLCRHLKGNVDTSHIPVLLLTAMNSTDDRVESYNAGADGYLSKPFELNVLEARIASLLRNRQHRLERFKSNAELSITTLEMASIDERFLENAIAVIEEHLAEPDFNLDTFSGQLNMSKSSLYRKIKSLTGMSPVEFTKNIRLKHACQLLNRQSGNVSDIAYAVGFSDPKYFTSCFKTAFSMTPTEYLKKHKEQNRN